MQEKKVYKSKDVEELFYELVSLTNEDYELFDKKIDEKGLSDYALVYQEVLAGGLPENEVCTPDFCENFCKGLQEIIDELKKK